MTLTEEMVKEIKERLSIHVEKERGTFGDPSSIKVQLEWDGKSFSEETEYLDL